jgi:hypothetical protein
VGFLPGTFVEEKKERRRQKGFAWRRELHVEIKQRMGSRARRGGEKVQEGGHAFYVLATRRGQLRKACSHSGKVDHREGRTNGSNS